MRKSELKPVAKGKIGKVIRNGVKLEPHEDITTEFLTHFGFNIEIIKPTDIPRVNNPDLLISGAIWEVKAPTTSSEETLKKRFKKASKQAGRIILDLRGVVRDYEKVEIENNRNLRKMMIITKSGKLLDFSK